MSESESYKPENPDQYWPGEWVAREDIEPNDWNPNELSDDEFDQLVKSIEDNGWTMPIVVHAEENYIIDGEHRWVAAKHLPDDPDLTPEDVPSDYVPVYGISVGEEQAMMATVQHNRARGEVRVDKLQDYLSGLQDRGVLDHVHDRIGYDDDDVSELLGDISSPSVTEDETMPWEEDEESADTDDSADDEGTSEPDVEIPELHRDRTLALRESESDGVDDEVLTNAQTITQVLTETEYEMMGEALGSEMRAQSLVNLARYWDDHDITLDD